MTTTTRPTTRKAPAPETVRGDGFRVGVTDVSPGFNMPQRMGRRLWLPMFAMALMGWTVGIILSIVEANTDRTDAATLQDLSHLVPAFMFIGFLGVFAAISFAIAKILGTFRQGGGEVQHTSGSKVQTLTMPGTAKLMLVFMMMGMMVMGAGVVVNFIAAANFDGVTQADIIDSASWGALSSGLRRMGVSLYLVGITFGLGTIIEVLRFQSIRIQEVAAQHGHSHN